MNKTYKLTDLTEKELKELESCKDIQFVLTEHHVIHQSHQTDDFGNEIEPTLYMYNVIVEIIPSTEERESKVETYISSLTLPGKNHRIDHFSREYSYLKEELGINLDNKKYNNTIKRKLPSTLGESLNEFEEKYIK